MNKYGLTGPFSLTDEEINRRVRLTSPGNYVLGDVNWNGDIGVSRTGRSDHDVNSRIHDYVGTYSAFMYGYASSAQAAFEIECQLYHDFDPPDNAIHPDRPNDTNWTCPCCAIFD